jgi:hypothetical protein
MPKVRKTTERLGRDLNRKIGVAGEFWLDKQPAWLGNYARVVEVPNKNGMVYVRMQSGQVIEVLNHVTPNIYNWAVYVGRDKTQPHILKVLETRWVHNLKNTLNYILFHHKQHEFPAPDTVFVYRDQFMPLLVYPNGDMTVRLFGDMIYSIGMSNPIRVPDQDIDLSGNVPSSGARYVLIELDSSGEVNLVNGTSKASREILEIEGAIPPPTSGSTPLCAIICYLGQTVIRRDAGRRDIVDLRMFTSSSGDAHTHVINLDDLDDVNAPSPTDGQVLTWDNGSSEWIAAEGGVPTDKALQIVMQPDLTDPPEPALNVEGDDYVYYEVEL